MSRSGLYRLLGSLRDNRKGLHLAQKRHLSWRVPPLLVPVFDDIRFIEVVGSKWKTTTAYCLAYHISNYYKVGLFTSPHLISVSERIQIWQKGEIHQISTKGLYRILKEVIEIYSGEGIELTYFEALFFSALLWFNRKGCDFVVLEAGLGGRLDATNAVMHNFVVLTKLELEHTAILGESFEDIVREKLAVIGQKTERVFIYKQFSEDFYRPYIKGVEAEFLEVADPYSLSGRVAESVLGKKLRPCRVRVPGRMEKAFFRGVEVILDVAHTPDSVSFVLNNISGAGWSVFLSLAKDKDIDGICLRLASEGKDKIDRIIYMEQKDDRFLTGDEFFMRAGLDMPVYLISISELRKYISRFKRVLVIGSHSLVGEAKRCLD